jgi:hypothetical protein
MALIPQISTCLNGCISITITDTTGFYNVTTNAGGWNNSSTVYRVGPSTPNVQLATITITLNSSPTPLIEPTNVLTTVQGAVFPTFDLYTYAPVDIFGNSTLADGSYTITYTIVDSNDIIYTTDTVVVVYCNVACCVSKLAVAVADELCNTCESEAFNTFVLADGILQALNAVAECSGEAEFLKLLNKLQRLCGTSTTGGCGCGCS